MDTLSSTLITLVAVHLVREVKAGFRKEMFTGEIPRPLFVCLNLRF